MEDKSVQRQISRRDALKVLAGGALVVGFSTATRSWITEAQAAEGERFARLPYLDGALHLDEATRKAYATDYGRIVSEKPLAVLKPGSVEDIARVIRFARGFGIRIVGRGRGHTVFGQSQARAAVVIDASTLRKIHDISGDRATVDAGIRWDNLLHKTFERGLTPPVLTDYLGLSVGGTLSVGGAGGASFRYGAQVDNVLELEVVTGEGERITCSGRWNRHLFEAALAGQGQCAVITRATIRLVPAPDAVRTFDLVYPDLTTLTRDLRRLMDDGRFDHLLGWAFPAPDGTWTHLMQAAAYFTPPEEPDNDALLSGLGHVPGTEQTGDTGYEEWANRVQPGRSRRPQPWLDLILPGPTANTFVGEIERTLRPLGADDFISLLLIPLKPARFTRPLFRAPETEYAFGFDILRTAPSDPKVVEKILAYNRTVYDKNRELGGTNYPISAVRLTREDWRRHYGPHWKRLLRAKRRYDPGNVFASGPDIFGSNGGAW